MRSLATSSSAGTSEPSTSSWWNPDATYRVPHPVRSTTSVGGAASPRLCVANWWPNKGVLELLQALAILPPGHVTLHLAGREDVDPGYSTRVHERLRAPDLAARVVVHGSLTPPEVARLYAGADVFVLASRAETFGIVFGEALAAGLPVVGWRTGNLPHLIEDGREGRLVAIGDVPELARALDRLATDDAWRDELTAAARRRGLRLPTWSDTADGFFGAIRTLAEGHD